MNDPVGTEHVNLWTDHPQCMYWIVARKRQGTKLVMVLSDERSKEEIARIKFIHGKLDMLKRQEKKIGWKQ